MPSHIGFESPLAGIRVVDLSRLLPGPFATMLLADLGAEVIKVEAPPGGDYARYYPPLINGVGALFAAINRDKKSVGVNLKQPGAAALLLDLVAAADVVVESFRPGVADRLGVGFDACRAVNPTVIYCAITGYGQDGPYAQRAGHDLNYLALSGLLEQTGTLDEPIVPGFQLADIAGGALYALGAINAALFQRVRSETPSATFLDISMTEGALAFHGPIQAMAGAGEAPQRADSLLSGRVPCYRVYPTADGGHLAVGALEPKFWIAFTSAIGLPTLARRGLDVGDRGREVVESVSARLAEHTLDEWTRRLASTDCCVEPVLSPAEAATWPHHRARGAIAEAPDGAIATGSPLKSATLRIANGSPPPALGQDTRVVFESLLSETTLDAALESGALVQAPSTS